MYVAEDIPLLEDLFQTRAHATHLLWLEKTNVFNVEITSSLLLHALMLRGLLLNNGFNMILGIYYTRRVTTPLQKGNPALPL